MLFPGPDGDAAQDNSGLLPCQNAEIVIQTRISGDDAEDGDVSQLVVQCRHLYIIIILMLSSNTYLQSANSPPLMAIVANPVLF